VKVVQMEVSDVLAQMQTKPLLDKQAPISPTSLL
jgi:hypothetical protein